MNHQKIRDMQEAASKCEIKMRNINNAMRLIEILYRKIKETNGEKKEHAIQHCINILNEFPELMENSRNDFDDLIRKIQENLIEQLLDELECMPPSEG